MFQHRPSLNCVEVTKTWVFIKIAKEEVNIK